MSQPQISGVLTPAPWMYDFRNPLGSIVYWLDQLGNVGLTGLYFADGTVQTSAAGAASGGVDTVQAISSNTSLTISASRNYLISATAGAGGIALTLPTAVGISGQRVKVLKVDTAVGAVTINTTASQTISGTLYGTSYSLTNYMQFVTLESDGSNWLVVARM